MGARDKLVLRGLRLFGRHGVLAAERQLGQPFVIDVDVSADLSRPGLSDDLADTLNYVRVVDIAQRVVHTDPPHALVERVAARIAANVLTDLPAAEYIRVRVEKPHVALPHVLSAIGVELERSRRDLQPGGCLHCVADLPSV